MREHVAIVAGAGRELGRATAEKRAAAGLTMVGVDRSEEGLKHLPDGIRPEAADPAVPAAARSVVDRIAADVGPPEGLVKTIGTYQLGEALTATREDRRLMIDVNLGSALADPGCGPVPAGTRFGFHRARGRPPGPGAPAAGMAAYAVSKAALVRLTRVLDLELRPLGIRVPAVAPQQLHTAKTHPYLTRRCWRKRLPRRRPPTSLSNS
jgi:NAD(P)-dependent dehydrogenase (short-subunit alcohol dehydrogenase family)